MLGTVVLAGVGCRAGDPGSRSGAALATTSSTGTDAEQTTTTSAGTMSPATSSSTITTAAPGRRPATPSSSATAPQAPSTTTTTEWDVPDENLRPTEDPDPEPWTPPSTEPPVVHTVWTPALGVEMTPPYEAPTVTAADYLGCTRQGSDNMFLVRARATLTGGRYWRFPGAANGTTGIFEYTYAGIVGQPVDPKGFDGTIGYVTVETGDGTHKNVDVSPPVTFHCQAA
jgi:hypothetical protein